MTKPFETTLRVRMFEIDAQGHLTGSAYLDYANQALWECLRAAGVDVDAMISSGVGPVNLETNIRFLGELRAGDEVTVTCALSFSDGKTYHALYEFRRMDGSIVAEITNRMGLLDLVGRRLIVEPESRWRALARDPQVLGLATTAP